MILLDTHIWWWALSETKQLSEKAINLISATPPNHRTIASISIWEFSMMVTRGRIKLKISPEEWLDYAINRTGCRVHKIKLITKDKKIINYSNVETVW